MTFSSILLTTVLFAPAQQPGERSGRSVESGASAMSEHIEVFRQILRQRLGRGAPAYARLGDGVVSNSGDPVSAYLGGQNIPFYPWAARDYWGGTVAHAGDFGDSGIEGVYLPGYGVVFTATLPRAARSAKSEDDKPAAKPMSEWERAQQELRGEKPEAAALTERRAPSLRDVILRVMAENGKHFTRLRDDERLTVVVTFRDGSRAVAASNLAPSLYGAMQPTTKLPAVNQVGQVAQPLLTMAQSVQSGKSPSSAHDYEMLADLHLKQQQYQAAAEAYEKALAAHKTERSGASAAETDDRQRVLTNRLAQSLLGLGHNDEALKLLAQVRTGAGAKPSSNPASAREQPRSRVPVKLVISATRRQMEQAASGGMTLDEFRKAATVEEE